MKECLQKVLWRSLVYEKTWEAIAIVPHCWSIILRVNGEMPFTQVISKVSEELVIAIESDKSDKKE